MKISYRGRSEAFESAEFDFLGEHQPELFKSIKLSASRTADTSEAPEEVAESDLIELSFEDQTYWYGPAGELPELLGQTKRSADGALEIPAALEIPLNERGGIKQVLIEGLKIFKPKAVTEPIAIEIAERIESKIVEEGLMLASPDMSIRPLEANHPIQQQHPVLLLLHGTCSSTSGSFGDLAGSDYWKKICSQYGSNILSCEHYTWTKSPLQNAVDLLEQIPAHLELHLLSHSRGGLIGELLSRCSHPATYFDESEIKFLEHEKRPADAKLLRRLNALAEEKQIRVSRFVRVAAPIAGTSLLSRRLDHFLNFLLNAIGLGIGQAVNPFFQGVRALLSSTISQRSNPKVLPGLEAMMPDSPLQKIFNNHQLSLEGDLRIIAGNAGIKGIGKTILYLLSRLYYFTDNDFVVDTDSMFMGCQRRSKPCYQFFIGSTVDHFSYFRQPDSQKAIQLALTESQARSAGFKEVSEAERKRALLPGGGLEPQAEIGGEKPIVVLLPGIMGSNLYDEEGPIWLNYRRIMSGDLSQLTVKAKGIAARSVVKTAYAKLAEELGDDYELLVFPFDWRLSLKKASEALAEQLEEVLAVGQPVKIIAHSMGGLVMRDLMMRREETWEKLTAQPHFRVLLLGTPWRGSYLIPEVITGYSRRVSQIALLSLFQSKKDLLEIFVQYPGLYELLPIDEEAHDFADPELWRVLKLGTGFREWVTPDGEGSLQHFREYREFVRQRLPRLDLSPFIYIAGRSDRTVSNFIFRDQNGGKIDKKKTSALANALNPDNPFGPRFYELIFTGTDQGDGSVTWRTGIPGQMAPGAVYYTSTAHMELANDERLFPAIRDLLEEGRTERLSNTRPLSRSAERIVEMPVSEVFSTEPEALLQGALGMDAPKPYQLPEQLDAEPIRVQVKNGDLRYASYPVMIGHFQGDGIVSAERAMDYMLNGRLAEREAVGLYPGTIGSNLVLLAEDGSAPGAIIVGLGTPEELTPFNLSQTIERACLEYIFQHRDTGQQELGISPLLIGSAYGLLSLTASIDSIVEGVLHANQKVQRLNEQLPTIKEVEFIELYRHIALNAFYRLNDSISLGRFGQRADLKHPIQEAGGRRTHVPLSNQKAWWKRITAAVEQEQGAQKSLVFQASSGRAKVPERQLFTNQELIRGLLKRGSLEDRWDRDLAKTVFELLLPHDFKSAFHSQQNILMILDEYTAWYPWELLHYDEKEGLPICVSAGMIRQLATKHDQREIKPVNNRRALVIGDPLLKKGGLRQLPEAEREAREVESVLQARQYDTALSVRETFEEVVPLLYKDFRIIHIASHGVLRYGPEGKTGILLSEDVVLSPAEFNQISSTPELVFINSCYMGKVEPEQEAYFQHKHELAANIGTQLIRNGVKAVVVAGWAVNDAAARLFATAFYEAMLDGAYFGEAVKQARSACYYQFPENTTWGAYQCYGDQFFVLEKSHTQEDGQRSYILDQEILIDLEQLLNDVRSGDKREEKHLRELEEIRKGIEASGLRNGKIAEMEASIYAELAAFDRAAEAYQRLQSSPKSDFSVKAVEQWCNLRAQLVVRDLLEGGREAVGEKHRAEMAAVLGHLQSLIAFGANSERYSLMGSAYKRLCFLEKKADALKAQLEKMAEQYKAACQWQNESLSQVRIYPLVNWIAAEKLLGEQGRLIQLSRLLPEPLTKYLEQLSAEAQRTRNHQEFWDFIEIINLKQVQLLDADTKAQRTALKNDIIEHYQAAWRIGGSKKQKFSELVHMQFFAHGLDVLGRGDTDLRDKVQQLVNFFKTL